MINIKSIKELQNEIVHLKNIIHRDCEQLFDAEDPMEPDVLFPEEEERLKTEIINCSNKITDLERKQMDMIIQLYPQIKESTLIETIDSHEIKYLLYTSVYKCPELLENEFNIKVILSYILQKNSECIFYSSRTEKINLIHSLSSSALIDENLNLYLSCENLSQFVQVLRSDNLMQDKEFKKLLMAYIENKSTDYISNIDIKEDILKKFPHISREFLFYPKKYLLEHIEDSKTLRYLSLMRKWDSNKSYNFDGSILKSIFKTYNCGGHCAFYFDLDELFITCDNEFDKLKIAILLSIKDMDIIKHTFDILHDFSFNYPSYKVSSSLIIALLRAANTNNQDILVNFLDKEEIERTILNKNSFYYHFLIKKINQDNYGTITSMFDLQEGDENIVEKLKHYFDQLETDYIYFTQTRYDEKVYKTPVTFYKQFIENALSEKDNYLDQCFGENQDDNFFCNAEILFLILYKTDYIWLAKEILKFGIDRPLHYDLNEEIYWNMLCKNIPKETESKETDLASDELVRMLYLKEETQETVRI